MLAHVAARQAWMRTAIQDEYQTTKQERLSHVRLDGLMTQAIAHLQSCAECRAAIHDPVEHPPQEAIRTVIQHLFQKSMVDPADEAGSCCSGMSACTIL